MKQTAQMPIGSGFGHGSTAAEAIAGIDLSGKTAFVTGGYAGLGLETTKALVSAGAQVIVAGRRPEEAEASLADKRDHVTAVKLELSDPASIDACAATVSGLTDKIDLLINNAGIMATPLTRDARGFESQFATNHLGHFQLAAQLWPLVKVAGSGARVVALTSLAHKRSAVHLDDPHFQHRDYEKWQAYGQAKTANALFALHLDRLAQTQGIRAFSVHPGGIATNLGRYLTEDDMAVLRARAKGDDVPGSAAMVWKTPAQGAATTIWAATSPMLAGKGGVYLEDCDIAELTVDGAGAKSSGVMAHACDSAAAEKLWALSEDYVGIGFQA